MSEPSATLSIYFPKKRADADAVRRLMKLAKKRDRSVNYLVVEAILQYLDTKDSAE